MFHLNISIVINSDYMCVLQVRFFLQELLIYSVFLKNSIILYVQGV